MSVIAWDGRELACDRMGVTGGVICTVQKYRHVGEAKQTIVVWNGTHEIGMALADWYSAGADPATWPECQQSDDWAELIVAQPSGLQVYQRLPIPQPVLDRYAAWGTGREIALGVLAMGGAARMAAEIASRHLASCGRGVDAFSVG